MDVIAVNKCYMYNRSKVSVLSVTEERNYDEKLNFGLVV